VTKVDALDNTTETIGLNVTKKYGLTERDTGYNLIQITILNI